MILLGRYAVVKHVRVDGGHRLEIRLGVDAPSPTEADVTEPLAVLVDSDVQADRVVVGPGVRLAMVRVTADELRIEEGAEFLMGLWVDREGNVRGKTDEKGRWVR